jgi:hypothetical protein
MYVVPPQFLVTFVGRWPGCSSSQHTAAAAVICAGALLPQCFKGRLCTYTYTHCRCTSFSLRINQATTVPGLHWEEVHFPVFCSFACDESQSIN